MSPENFYMEQRNIRVAVSPKCNLGCVYCDSRDGRGIEKPGSMEDFRHKPLNEGVISANTYVKLIESMVKAGFVGMSMTGGEPLLNKNWDTIAVSSLDVGMSRIGVTTNGMLLEQYIKTKKSFPEGLAMLTVSLDTTDPDKYKSVTRGGKLDVLFNGLKAVKSQKPDLPIRVNKVVLRSDLALLPDYISDCEKCGAINEIKLLNLILKLPDEGHDLFQKEFVTTKEIKRSLDGIEFTMNDKHDFETVLPGGIKILLMDTNPTLRNEQCEDCKIYCQEGFFTVRIATDGTIAVCPDYTASLPYIDGPLELARGQLDEKVSQLVEIFQNLTLQDTLLNFFRSHNIIFSDDFEI